MNIFKVIKGYFISKRIKKKYGYRGDNIKIDKFLFETEDTGTPS